MTSHFGSLALAATILALATACAPSPATDTDDGAHIYITSGLTDEVLKVSAADGRIIDRFTLNLRRDEIDEPHGIAVAPDGRHWYATLSHGNPTLWKFELPDDRLVGRLSLNTYGAARIGITPDGSRAFIPDYHRSGQGTPSGITVVELHDLVVVDQPVICPAPHDAQVDPAGTRVAVACSLSDELVIIDASTLTELNRFFVGEEPGPAGSPRFKPLNLVWSPEGDVLYVTLAVAGEVMAFDLDGAIKGSAALGGGPAQLALTQDGRTLVVANRGDASVSLLSTSPLEERARISIDRPHPHGVALEPTGRTAFVTYEGDLTSNRGGVVAIDLGSGQLLWSVEAGAYALGVAYRGDG